MSREPIEIAETRRALQLTAWMLALAILIMTIWPFDLSPEDPLATGAGRIEAYGVIAAIFMLGYPHRPVFALTWPIVLAVADGLLPLIFLAHPLNVGGLLWKALGIGVGAAVALLTRGSRTNS